MNRIVLAFASLLLLMNACGSVDGSDADDASADGNSSTDGGAADASDAPDASPLAVDAGACPEPVPFSSAMAKNCCQFFVQNTGCAYCRITVDFSGQGPPTDAGTIAVYEQPADCLSYNICEGAYTGICSP